MMEKPEQLVAKYCDLSIENKFSKKCILSGKYIRNEDIVAHIKECLMN